MRISDWSSDVCSSDLLQLFLEVHGAARRLLAVAQRGVEDQHAATNCLGASSLGASSLGASSLGAGRLGAGPLGAGRSLPPNFPRFAECRVGDECGSNGKTQSAA